MQLRDSQSVLRSLIGPGRSLENFRKSNRAVLPIFCSTTELIKDRKVVNFGPNLITQFRARQVFILSKPVFFAFFGLLPISPLLVLKKEVQRPNFDIYWSLAILAAPQKFKGAFLITFPKTGQDRSGPKDRLTIFTRFTLS